DPSGTDKEYWPSRSVAVPILVPDTETVTPGIGSPPLSSTVPRTTTSNIAVFASLADFGSVSITTSAIGFPCKGAAWDRFRKNRKKNKPGRKYFPLPWHACEVFFIDMRFMLNTGKCNILPFNKDYT